MAAGLGRHSKQSRPFTGFNTGTSRGKTRSFGRLRWSRHCFSRRAGFTPVANGSGASNCTNTGARCYCLCLQQERAQGERAQKCPPHRERRLREKERWLGMSKATSPSMPVLSASRALLKSRLREFWNSQTLYWDLMTEEIAGSSGNRARAASFIPEGSRILDVACGSASNCVWLLKRGKYFGTDISQSGLRRAQRPELQLACADAEALPFAEGSFDAVISTYALEHSVAPIEMLREMVNVVRTGGRIVLLGPTWDLPFWYPNALRSRAGNISWRLRYTVQRIAGQARALLGGCSP